MEFEDRHEVISCEIACFLTCTSLFTDWENKVHSPVSTPYPAFLGKRKKSDWHTSAAKDDRYHGHPIHWRGPAEALGR